MKIFFTLCTFIFVPCLQSHSHLELDVVLFKYFSFLKCCPVGAVDGEETPGHAQGEFSNISAGYTTKLAARRSKDALR